jgi:serpin B
MERIMKASSMLTLLISVTLFLNSGCESNVAPSDEDLNQDEIKQAAGKLVEADQSFSLEMFREVVKQDETENIFISPLSISMALGMTLNGAKGETYEEIQQTLNFENLEMQEINEGYHQLIEDITNADPDVQAEIANSVWNKEGFKINDAFRNALQTYFEAEARELDFTDPESVDIINGWIADKTHDKITGMLDEIPPSAVMYLINAVYFNGSWKYEFDPEETKQRTFYLENGDNVEVDMMSQRNTYAHYQSDEVQMVDVPYGDSLFTMTLMMPTDADTPLDEFIVSELTQENLQNWYSNLSTEEVDLILPKVELEYKVTLNEMLKALGMNAAFTDGADFSGINTDPSLQISRILHQTYLKMDEVGTEAAGVTIIEFVITSINPNTKPVYRFDRPYVMILREQSTGAILFVGKIMNPEL